MKHKSFLSFIWELNRNFIILFIEIVALYFVGDAWFYRSDVSRVAGEYVPPCYLVYKLFAVISHITGIVGRVEWAPTDSDAIR